MTDSRGESLDPGDWEDARRAGYETVDRLVSFLSEAREHPWRPIPDEFRQRFRASVPREGLGTADALEELADRLLSYPLGNTHPRFWAWVTGTGTWEGALGALLAAGVNANGGGGQAGVVLLEQQLMGWLKEMLGYPSGASGLLVSGGSVANLVGMTVGLHHALGPDVREEGLVGMDARPLVYVSEGAHFSVARAVRLLGLGEASLRTVPADDAFRIRTEVLREQIRADRETGARPVMAVANVGSVNTGAVDDVEAMAAVCRDEGLWLHADGAFGALAALSPEIRDRVTGMERADSLAFDLHKWMHVPYDAGCVLVRDEEAHRAPFSYGGDYVDDVGGIAADTNRFSELGIQQSRGARAAKAWATIAAHGAERLGRTVAENVRQAERLGRLVEASEGLELLAPVALNVVCFRYVGTAGSGASAGGRPGPDSRASGATASAAADAGYGDEILDDLNRRILVELQEEGIAVPSHTRVRGRFAIRCAIVNHRSRDDDFDALVDAVETLGDRLGRGEETPGSGEPRG